VAKGFPLVIKWPTEFPTILVDEFSLRKARPSDKDAFIEMIVGDADIVRFTTVPDPYDESHADSKLLGADEPFSNRSALEFVIADESDQLIGQIALWGVNEFDHFVSIGYMLNKKVRGSNIMPRVIEDIVDYAFSIGFRRVQADVMCENSASIRALEKAGFEREAVLKFYATNRDGSQSDSYLYARVR
jgi:ribosomal-protein-alanine N-acetyltransferase